MSDGTLWNSITGWLSPRRRDGLGDLNEARLLRNLLDAAPAALVTLDRTGGVVTWNRAAERLFGWKLADVAAQQPPYLLPESGAAEAAARQRVLSGNELHRRRGRFRRREGEELDLLVSSAPQRDAEGAIIGIVNVFEEPGPAAGAAPPASPLRDPAKGASERALTEPSRAGNGDAAFAAAARDGATGREAANEAPREPASQFLARIGHDLRQPLHALSLLTGALERRVKEPESRDLVANAGTLVRALQDTFDNILDLARLDEGRVPANPIVAPAAEMMAPVAAEIAREAAKRGIAFRYVASNRAMRADPILLQRLLRQLLGNALRFAEHPDGTPGKILLGARRRGDRLRIVVADDGIGVPADQTTAIFNPFVQLDAGRAGGGLGLGLAIAQRLARLLQSEIRLRSTPGKGSMFWLDLPAASAG